MFENIQSSQVIVGGETMNYNEGYSTRDMAKDQAEAMKALGISKASVMGVSQGGMIWQSKKIIRN